MKVERLIGKRVAQYRRLTGKRVAQYSRLTGTRDAQYRRLAGYQCTLFFGLIVLWLHGGEEEHLLDVVAVRQEHCHPKHMRIVHFSTEKHLVFVSFTLKNLCGYI
jgi:hypothetical protein